MFLAYDVITIAGVHFAAAYDYNVCGALSNGGNLAELGNGYNRFVTGINCSAAALKPYCGVRLMNGTYAKLKCIKSVGYKAVDYSVVVKLFFLAVAT